jgi:hypothetical protein
VSPKERLRERFKQRDLYFRTYPLEIL